MKTLIHIILFIGIVFVIVGYVSSRRRCPPAKVEYRYVPRTFVEEQEQPVPVEEIFAKMFREQQPWLGGFSDIHIPRNDNINKHFISAS